ncbi:hypothetical protein ACFQZE_07380 [Paenibacillus sp. GCM10027627]|uniref:hypothetical protein n=1 Tax=unclassified Paenibacillus TaxID=185978 RepID=UPI00363C950B
MGRQKRINQTKLGLQHIINENKKYEQLQRVTIDGIGFTETYKHFSPNRIEIMFDNFSKFINDYQATIGQMNEKQTLDYMMLFIVLFFSTLVKSIPESFEEKLDIFEQILNSEIAEKVAESFDKNEVTKIMDRLMKKFEAIQQISKESTEMKNKLKEHVLNSNLENKELILKTMFNDGMSEEVGEERV